MTRASQQVRNVRPGAAAASILGTVAGWLATLGSLHGALLAVALFWCAAAALGAPMAAKGLPRLASAACGACLLGLLSLVLGTAGLMKTAVLLPTGLLLATCGLVVLGRQARGVNVRAWLSRHGLPFLLFLLFALGALGPALCYPAGWDEMVYHVALPRRWLELGGAAVLPDNPYSGFPALTDLLNYLVTATGGILAPRLLTWSVSCVNALLLYGLLRRRFGQAAALVLTGSVMLAPAMMMVAREAYAEPFLVLALLAALSLVLAPVATRRSAAWRVAIGLLAGGAAAVKLSGIPVAATILLLALWRSQRRAAAVTAMLTAAVLLAAPFYLRPWLATGNPCYPYYAALFAADPAQVSTSEYHHAVGQARFGLPGLTGFLQTPFLLAVPVGETQLYFEGSLGFQALLVGWLLVVAMARACRRRRLRPWLVPAALALLLYLFWFWSAPQARFLLPGFCLAAVTAFQSLRRQRPLARRTVLVTLAAATLFWPLQPRELHHYSFMWRGVNPAVRVSFLRQQVGEGYAQAVAYVREHTPPNAKLLLLFENRGLYVPRQYVLGTPFWQAACFTPPERYQTKEAVTAELQRLGVTHVLMGLSNQDPDRVPTYLDRCRGFAAGLGQLVAAGTLRPVWQCPDYQLLEVSKGR